MAPRTVRFYAAVAVLTLGTWLTPAVGTLPEAIAANQKTYD